MSKTIKPSSQGDIPVGTAQLHYAIFGEGVPDLLLLHGNGESIALWDEILPRLVQSHTVLAIDSRGHGASTMGEEDLTILRMAEDTAAVLASASIPSIAVLGFSDGANIALRLALEHPERVRALILAGGNLDPGGVKSSIQTPIVIGYQTCRFFGFFSKEAKKKAAIMRLMVEEPMIPAEKLQRIKAPTLVMAGEHDMIKETHTRLIAESIPGAELCILPGADHFVFGRTADAACDAVLAFLEAVR